jgi:hypothetical protein
MTDARAYSAAVHLLSQRHVSFQDRLLAVLFVGKAEAWAIRKSYLRCCYVPGKNVFR